MSSNVSFFTVIRAWPHLNYCEKIHKNDWKEKGSYTPHYVTHVKDMRVSFM